jgi:hypothetical protein
MRICCKPGTGYLNLGSRQVCSSDEPFQTISFAQRGGYAQGRCKTPIEPLWRPTVSVFFVFMVLARQAMTR